MTDKSKTTLVLADISLATIPKAVSDQFAKFKDKIIKPNDIKDFEVNTDDSQAIAESKIKEINGLKTQIKNKSDEMKNPLNYIKNIVLQSAKLLDDDLTMSKSILNKKITEYKNIKIAQLKAEEDKKRAELEKDKKRKQEILDRITFILGNFTSLLFGGDIKTTTGEDVYKDAPDTIKDLEKVKEFIVDKFPNVAVFQEYEHKMLEHYTELMSDIEAYKIFMEQGQTEAISKLKIKYYNLCNRSVEETKKIVEKEEKLINKKLEQEIKEAGKGFRETLKYDVSNLAEVPERFKTVDTVKLNDYISRNRDKLKEMAKTSKGHEPVPGITFRVERTNVTY